MRTDELIIDGVSVDLADAKIALKYTNNILSDIDKISASHSYTITLPLTVKNERVFDYVTSVAHQSSKVGKFLDAEYRRNGIAVVKNAKAYVTKMGESGIEICILWDGLARLSAWLKEGHTLNELPLPELDIWDGIPYDYYDRHELVVQANYDTGIEGNNPPPTPSVNLSELLSWVIAEAGLDYRIDVPGMASELRELFMPLASRGGTRSRTLGGVFGLSTYNGGIILIHKNGEMVFESSGGTAYADVSAFYSVDVAVNYSVRKSQYTQDSGVSVTVGLIGGKSSTFRGVLEGDYWVIRGNVKLDIAKETQLGVYVSGMRYPAYGIVDFRGEMSITPYTNVASYGDAFDIGKNLPSIKQVDFIKTICTLFGAQVVNQNGQLVFVSIDSYYRGLASVVDWTDKVVNMARVAKSATFGLKEYAQANWLRYAKPDKDAEGLDADGAFYVENETLDKEKDAAKVFFAPSDGSIVAHYEKDDKGKVKDVKVTPRVLRAYMDDNGQLALEFPQSLYMSSIINRWYGGLRRLLEYPVEMTIYARLDERDLASLDWTRPVYLRQTGKYYIVKEISTDSDGEISELTLLQL